MSPRARRTVTAGGLLLAWLVVAAGSWAWLFTHSRDRVVVASHDAVVRPTFDGHVTLDLGPYLPDVRHSTGSPVGVQVVLGKTTAGTPGELVKRYAAIAAHPGAEERRVRNAITGMAVDAAVGGALIGLVPLGLWFLVGRERRRQLVRRVGPRSGAATATAIALVVLLLARPWDHERERVQADVWIPVQDAFTDVQVPEELQGWQIQGGLVTQATRRLLTSMFDTYDKSIAFYDQVLGRVDGVADSLHAPEEGQTAAVLVSDRHDNIGMDEVVRKVADAAGATVVLDAGDDTSTGETWEAFSLDSLDKAFDGYDAQVAIAGNHDNGPFVNRYLERLGWTHLDGKAVEPFAGVRMTGVDDPRSSGLGSWRDENGLSFEEVEARIADDVCALDEDGERIATLLVHDAHLGRTALRRGCTDLVLAGHLHVQRGPDRVEGENGKVGYSYTNGTTGGAAFAIALGSKLRREAEFTLVTYADGRPVGIQPVKVRPSGRIVVAPYVPLDLSRASLSRDSSR